jgi:predicted nucleotidyltransferase component of viral defense system
MDQINLIRKLTIISLFADDLLMDTFVLKGGNAISTIYGITDRSSIDIDVSMTGNFKPEELEDIENRLEKALTTTFLDHKFEVFDVKLTPKPKELRESTKTFWGGYSLLFKVIEKNKTHLPLESKRKQALLLGPGNSAKFKVDISSFEYCEPKEITYLDDYTIYVYSPIMLVYEKLRAICQQMPAYTELVQQKPRPRARDFYDIHTIIAAKNLANTVFDDNNIIILSEIFKAKKVPLDLLAKIGNQDQRDYHTADFETLIDNISNKKTLQDFDFYFDYVAKLALELHSLWKKQAPSV